MPDVSMYRTILREILTRKRSPRIPEPDLVMDSAAKVDAYTYAGRELSVMAQSYLFNSAHICDVIRPGDKVIDLACRPATQLGMVASMFPEVEFIGVDLSKEMLQIAQEHLADEQIHNVELRVCDITSLDFLNTDSVDTVISTFSLHHLPTLDSLAEVFAEADRVLKDGGGLYLSDFSHLKSDKSIEYFATRHAHLQPDYFTEDYRHSLRAAFYLSDVKWLVQDHLSSKGRLYSMTPMPFTFVIKSETCNIGQLNIKTALEKRRKNLPPFIEEDLRQIIRSFRADGLRTQLLD